MPKRTTWEQKFFEARAPILRNKLSPQNQIKFDAMSFDQKRKVITRMIEKGHMI